MQHQASSAPDAPPADERLSEILALAGRIVERQSEDPFGNPVLGIALNLSRRLDENSLDVDALGGLVRRLRDDAFAKRAERIARYVGLEPGEGTGARLRRIAEHLVRPDPDDSPVPLAAFRKLIGRTRFAAVFTAHPTFALAPDAYAALAASACGAALPASESSHRPPAPTLEDEFGFATAAILRGRDAIDRFNRALLEQAATVWPQSWTTLVPKPLILTSWVGYDTDGRTDIGWWDTLRLRLRMKKLQLDRLLAQVEAVQSPPDALTGMLSRAIDAVSAQIAAAPDRADPDQVSRFAAALVDRRNDAIPTVAPLDDAFAAAIETAANEDKMPLAMETDFPF